MLIAGGEEFAHGHSSLRILSLMVSLLFFTAALDFLFVAGKTGWYVVTESIAIGLTILGGLLFVPAFSTVGMAAVAVVAYLISGIIGLMVLTRTRTLVMGPVAKEFARMSILIAPSLLVFALPQLAWWLQCVAFSTLAILTLTVFRFWDDVDKALLLQLTDLVRSDRIQKQ
jgi:hypothetical protein